MFFGLPFVNLARGCSPLAGKMASAAQLKNAVTIAEIFNRFSNIGITRLYWTGLPDSISERFLNMSLYFYGQVAFFEDENLGLLALPCTTAGEYNVYYEPVRVDAFSFNYNRVLNKDEFVYIRNNPTATPTAFTVWAYTTRMADILRTLDTELKHLKHPYILLCEEKRRLTFENILKKIDDNEWFLLGSKDFDMKKDELTKVDLNTESNLMDLWNSYKQIENILYTAMGIDSADNEKRERLLVDEVNANMMITEMSIETTVKELKAGCKKVNEKYGLNIDVNMRNVVEYRQARETMEVVEYE